MLDWAISKSGAAASQVSLWLLCSGVTLLGIVWLSIAVTTALALVVPPPLAPAITGALMIGISSAALLIRSSLKNRKTIPAPSEINDAQNIMTRATHIAGKLAPDSPLTALSFAALTGWLSLNVPTAFSPLLVTLLDTIEALPKDEHKVQSGSEHDASFTPELWPQHVAARTNGHTETP
jgi:hypothetical protein